MLGRYRGKVTLFSICGFWIMPAGKNIFAGDKVIFSGHLSLGETLFQPNCVGETIDLFGRARISGDWKVHLGKEILLSLTKGYVVPEHPEMGESSVQIYTFKKPLGDFDGEYTGKISLFPKGSLWPALEGEALCRITTIMKLPNIKRFKFGRLKDYLP